MPVQTGAASRAVFWAMSYRADPARDTQLLRHKDRGHGPRAAATEDSALLVNATLRRDAPPVSLPERRYMEAAKGLWERLGLPALRPEAPWHGYSLGQWSDEWDAAAGRAADGNYLENGRISYQKRRADVAPNTAVGDVVAPGGVSERG